MWGFLICGAQAAGLEHNDMKTATWNGATSAPFCLYFLCNFAHASCYSFRFVVGILIAYTACTFVSRLLYWFVMLICDFVLSAMFILYTVAPLLYRMASSTYYNLSLLSSDFYGLLFGEENLSLSDRHFSSLH